MKIDNGFLITLEGLSCYVRRIEKDQYYELSQHAIYVDVDYLSIEAYRPVSPGTCVGPVDFVTSTAQGPKPHSQSQIHNV